MSACKIGDGSGGTGWPMGLPGVAAGFGLGFGSFESRALLMCL